MTSLLHRYHQGEHIEVWEILARSYRAQPKYAKSAEFEEVMRETFMRLRINTERIIERLRDLGYEFESESPRYGTPAPPLAPTATIGLEAIAWIKDRYGLCPPVLEWFCDLIGSVDLRQSHRQLSDPSHSSDPVIRNLGDWDPLVFDGLEYFACEIREEGKADPPQQMRDGRMGVELQFAPDRYHKANISGGDDYIICLPSDVLDPIIFEAGVSFMTYLRNIIARGGFWGVPKIMLDRGYGWLGKIEVEPGIFLPDHWVFARLANDLEPF